MKSNPAQKSVKSKCVDQLSSTDYGIKNLESNYLEEIFLIWHSNNGIPWKSTWWGLWTLQEAQSSQEMWKGPHPVIIYGLWTIQNIKFIFYKRHLLLMLNLSFFTPDASRRGFATKSAKKRLIQRWNLTRKNLKIPVIHKICWKKKSRPKWGRKKKKKEDLIDLS